MQTDVAFEFPMYQGEKKVVCRVEPSIAGATQLYLICFDDKPVGALRMGEDATWLQVQGAIWDCETVQLIGRIIEDHFE